MESVQPKSHTDPAARLIDAVKRYGPVTALDQIQLDLRAGELTALLGANGAGKTTAVRSLLGLNRLDSGRAEIFGGGPQDRSRRMRTGAMLQVSGVPDTLRVREHIQLFSSYYPSPLPMAVVLDATGLGGLEERLYGKLSGGQQQRLLFALAVCGDPELLFLDEPTVGLDVTTRKRFWGYIRQLLTRGRTILLTTHYLEEADLLADRIVVIQDGRIVADGSPAEIKTRAAARKVRCRTQLASAVVAALPGVQRVAQDGPMLSILTSQAEPLLPILLAQDPSLRDLEVTGAGLEEAFLSLTSSDDDTLAEQGAA